MMNNTLVFLTFSTLILLQFLIHESLSTPILVTENSTSGYETGLGLDNLPSDSDLGNQELFMASNPNVKPVLRMGHGHVGLDSHESRERRSHHHFHVHIIPAIVVSGIIMALIWACWKNKKCHRRIPKPSGLSIPIASTSPQQPLNSQPQPVSYFYQTASDSIVSSGSLPQHSRHGWSWDQPQSPRASPGYHFYPAGLQPYNHHYPGQGQGPMAMAATTYGTSATTPAPATGQFPYNHYFGQNHGTFQGENEKAPPYPGFP